MKQRKPVLLLASLLAILALAPATAQAEPYLTGESLPVWTEDAVTPSNQITIKAAGGSVVCSSGSIAGAVAKTETRSLDLTPYLTECKMWGLGVSPTAVYGCELNLGIENAGPPYTAAASLASCWNEAGAFVIEDKHGLCKVSMFPSEAQPQTASLVNTGSGSSRAVEAELNITNIKYTAEHNSIWCPLNKGTKYNGAISGATTIRSTPVLEPIGLFVTGEQT